MVPPDVMRVKFGAAVVLLAGNAAALSFEEDAEPPEHEGYFAPSVVPYQPRADRRDETGCKKPISECKFKPGQVIRHFGKLGVVQACDKCFVGAAQKLCANAHKPFYSVIMDMGRVESPEDTRYIAEEEVVLYGRAEPPRIAHSAIAAHFPGGFVPRLREFLPATILRTEFRVSAEPL